MSRHLSTVLISILVCARFVTFSQDIHLSQFTEAPLLRNPAMAGLFKGDYQAYGVFRNQWQSVGVPYRTFAAGGEFKFRIGSGYDYLTTGLSFMYDDAGSGIIKQTLAMPVLNYHKSLNNERNRYLSLGFGAGIATRGLGGGAMTFDNQFVGGVFVPNSPSGERAIVVSRTFLDMAVGLTYNGSVGSFGDMFLGVSYWHFNHGSGDLNGPKSFVEPKAQFNGGVKGFLSDRVSMHVEGNWLIQGKSQEILLLGLLRYQIVPEGERSSGIPVSVALGLAKRMNDAFVPIVRLRSGRFEGGVSYDLNTSTLRSASQTRGGYEVTFSYRGFTAGSQSSLLQSRCPRF
jgi:type IX secretion system PorP/SprF family membrane protein